MYFRSICDLVDLGRFATWSIWVDLRLARFGAICDLVDLGFLIPLNLAFATSKNGVFVGEMLILLEKVYQGMQKSRFATSSICDLRLSRFGVFATSMSEVGQDVEPDLRRFFLFLGT